jgi:3-oxoadipate enol-lactonase
MDEDDVEIDGARWGVFRAGSGLPMVCVHGFPLDHRMYRALLDHPLPGIESIVVDLPGFGRGHLAQPDATLSMEVLAHQLFQVLDAIAVRQPVLLVGLSMGGYIAFECWRHAATRIAGLVLSNTRADADTDAQRSARMQMVARTAESGIQFVVDSMLPRLLPEKSPIEVVHQVTEMIRETPVATIRAAQSGIGQRRDSTPLLPSITCPTLVIAGQLDAITPEPMMRGLSSQIPDATMVVAAEAGHVVPIERPEWFAQQIRAWWSPSTANPKTA